MKKAMMVINPSFGRFLFPWILFRDAKEPSAVYLTFDDGPHPAYTPTLLNILDRYRVKATFFVIGEKALLYPGIVEKIKSEGHTIGNHSFSHSTLMFQKKERIEEEITRTDHTIQKLTGQRPLFFRPPHGWFDVRFRKLMQDSNHRMVLWSLLPYDFQETNSQKLTERIRKNLKPGSIIALHDGHPNSSLILKALPDILDWIKTSGFETKSLNARMDENA